MSTSKTADTPPHIDPVCGMTVEETNAITADRDGQTFYFCSAHCRSTFLSGSKDEPAAVAEPAGCCGGAKPKPAAEPPKESCCSGGHSEHSQTVSPPAAAKYFCPMCPGVESDRPGDCPKCGMALELNPLWVPESRTIYTCPMHPEVEQAGPGDCPKCGMPLEPRDAPPAEEDSSEARDLSRRFWIGTALSLPVLILAMSHLIPGFHLADWIEPRVNLWIQFARARRWSCGRAGLSSCARGARLQRGI